MFFSLMFYKAMQSIIALSILLSFGLRSADGDVFFVSAAAAAAADDDDGTGSLQGSLECLSNSVPWVSARRALKSNNRSWQYRLHLVSQHF